MHSAFWAADALATEYSRDFGGIYEIRYSDGKYTVERAPLLTESLCPDYRKWRDALYLGLGLGVN